MKIPNLPHLQSSLVRIMSFFSSALKMIADSIEEIAEVKADKDELKDYIRSIEVTENGIKFSDGNGNIVCEIKKL